VGRVDKQCDPILISTRAMVQNPDRSPLISDLQQGKLVRAMALPVWLDADVATNVARIRPLALLCL
jgi:hypothetical protein